MTVHCEDREKGGCGGPVLAYVLEGARGSIAVLCETHRKPRIDIAVRDWGELVFPAAYTDEIVRLHRACEDAEKSFVQRFDPDAKCVSAMRGGCGGGVTTYYFSDGDTRLLCLEHRKRSHALMSKQYNEEVYENETTELLAETWDKAMAESRAAALVAKK